MRGSFIFGTRAQRAFALGLFALGLIAVIFGWSYGVGQLNDIGPGAFPLGLGAALMILSGVAFFARRSRALPGVVHLKPLILIPAGIAAWALLVEAGGLLVANAALVGLMFFSEDDLKIRTGILLTIFLTIGGYVVLVLGFHLPFHILGEWL